jgi:hypothetical protein
MRGNPAVAIASDAAACMPTLPLWKMSSCTSIWKNAKVLDSQPRATPTPLSHPLLGLRTNILHELIPLRQAQRFEDQVKRNVCISILAEVHDAEGHRREKALSVLMGLEGEAKLPSSHLTASYNLITDLTALLNHPCTIE